jgi:glutathione S-transferase
MKLLGSKRSPFAFKVMVMIAEKGLDCAIEAAAPSSEEVAEVSPLSKVPVLIRDDGKALYDSSVIVDYLDGLTPNPKLIPKSFEDRIEVKRCEALCDGIMGAAVAIFYEDRVPESQRVAHRSKQQKKIDAGLATLAKDLGDREFCHGDNFTLADIACGSALVCLHFRLPDMDWRQAYPVLARHAERMAERESFKAANSRD